MNIRKVNSKTLVITRFQNHASHASRFGGTVKEATAEAKDRGFSTTNVSITKLDGPLGKIERRTYTK